MAHVEIDLVNLVLWDVVSDAMFHCCSLCTYVSEWRSRTHCP